MAASNKTWENIVYKLIILIFVLITGYFGGIVYIKLTATDKSNPISLKINDISKNNRLDSLAVIKLENEIKLVENKNDGRFEVLTWSATLLISLLVILMGVNFISSNAKAEDTARDEIDKKTTEIVNSFNLKLENELKRISIRGDELIVKMEEIQMNAERDWESLNTFISKKTDENES